MKRSMKDAAKGTFHELKGRVKETVGRATNNPALAAKGQREKIGGKIQQKIGQEDNMKLIGMVLAIAVLAGSILSGCATEPMDGRYGGRGYYGDRGYFGERGYYEERGFSSGYSGPDYHRGW